MHNPRRAAGRFNPTTAVANLVRGMLIGLAELVPGVSGGTIALISGIYEPLINSASHVVSAVKRVVTGKFSEAGRRAQEGSLGHRDPRPGWAWPSWWWPWRGS